MPALKGSIDSMLKYKLEAKRNKEYMQFLEVQNSKLRAELDKLQSAHEECARTLDAIRDRAIDSEIAVPRDWILDVVNN